MDCMGPFCSLSWKNELCWACGGSGFVGPVWKIRAINHTEERHLLSNILGFSFSSLQVESSLMNAKGVIFKKKNPLLPVEAPGVQSERVEAEPASSQEQTQRETSSGITERTWKIKTWLWHGPRFPWTFQLAGPDRQFGLRTVGSIPGPSPLPSCLNFREVQAGARSWAAALSLTRSGGGRGARPLAATSVLLLQWYLHELRR